MLLVFKTDHSDGRFFKLLGHDAFCWSLKQLQHVFSLEQAVS
jgi:hypothetical protein